MNGPLVCELDKRQTALMQSGGVVTGIRYVDVIHSTNAYRISIHLFRSLDKRVLVELRQGSKTIRSTEVTADSKITFDVKSGEIGDAKQLEACLSPSPHVDPVYSRYTFDLNPGRSRRVDFLTHAQAMDSNSEQPVINYLAKDYSSFKRLILDRFSLLMPDWKESHEADLGMTLVELLAYVGDQLSYQQDAVATEAYLETARQRISVRRHARLVDYQVDEGENARTYVHCQVSRDVSFHRQDVLFCTKILDPRWSDVPSLSLPDLDESDLDDVQLFEPATSGPTLHCLRTDVTCPQKFKDHLARFLADYPSGFSGYLMNLASESAEEFLKVLVHECQLKKATGTGQGYPDRLRQSVLNRQSLQQSFSDALRPVSDPDRIPLYFRHNEIHFYDWQQDEYCLEPGATEAYLIDAVKQGNENATDADRQLNRLAVGDQLLLEEIKGSNTGNEADRNTELRQLITITSIEKSTDPVDNQILLLKVCWDPADQLRHRFYISRKLGPPYCQTAKNLSVARGNIVFLDHGQTIEHEYIGRVDSLSTSGSCPSACHPDNPITIPLPFQTTLKLAGLTQLAAPKDFLVEHSSQDHLARPKASQVTVLEIPADANGTAIVEDPSYLLDANTLFRQLLRTAGCQQDSLRWFVERILSNQTLRSWCDFQDQLKTLTADARRQWIVDHQQLSQDIHGELLASLTWVQRNDLLHSRPDDQHFVVEIDDHRTAHLRFGDSVNGKQPPAGSRFYASYRVGSGVSGNVGANSISHILFRKNYSSSITQIRNPFSATGGREPEPTKRAKLIAPHDAINKQWRGILPEDYNQLTIRKFGQYLQNVQTTIQQFDTAYQVRVILDFYADVSADHHSCLCDQITSYLNHYRRINHQISVTIVRPALIELTAEIMLLPTASESEVRMQMMERFSDQVMSDGTLGYFHPDRLTFGQTVYRSHLVTEALKIDGIRSVSFSISPSGNQQDRDIKIEPDQVIQLKTLHLKFRRGAS